MSLLAARTALLASRRIASSRSAVNASMQTKRRMGSGAAAPEWEGIDKVVRGYFPQDDQREIFIRVLPLSGNCLMWHSLSARGGKMTPGVCNC
eukprot:scaffold17741_cov67-Cyclotella_meneghiniana.AAC.4